MTKQEFCKKYKIAYNEIVNPQKELLYSHSVAEGIKEFLNDSFRGAVEVCSTVSPEKTVALSTEYTATFLKRLVVDVFGRVIIKIAIDSDEENMMLHISSDEPIPLCEEELHQLIKIARNAGFEFYLTEDGMLLTVKFAEDSVYYIYAISSQSKRRMRSKLFEMFFGGPLIGEDFDAPAVRITKRKRGKGHRTKTSK